jgi:alkanesulfonate monooxygenase SsuD/methylene tetrahydromethanopterin reductase-like flavin-dependent oxidoreductase (luciferase family)
MPVMAFAKPHVFSENLIISYAQEAESLGYDSLSVNDHLVFRRSWLDPISVLGAVAAATTAIKLGTSILNIVVRNPMICAQAIATIDNLSSGRLFVGVGPGSYRQDFEACNMPFEERWARFAEALEVLPKLLSERTPINYIGKYYRFKDLPPILEPSQKPHPPILVGSWGSELGLRRAAKYGDGWMASAYNITPTKFKEKWQEVLSYRRALGKDTQSFENFVVSMFGFISDDNEKVNRVLKEFLAPALARSEEELKNSLLFGPIDDCLQKIKSYAEAGAQQIQFWPVEDHFQQMRLFRKITAEAFS